MTKTPITVAYGDGIGPEIMKATLKIMEAAGAQLDIDTIEIGEKNYLSGFTSGIKPEAWESLNKSKVFLKAPITTPSGGGYKSLNVTIRKTLGLYANTRPCISYHPFVDTKHPVMDLVIVRENEEDTYAGIEHQQTNEVTQCLKLITRPGCEKIVRFAFEYAKAYGRKKVTCMVKDNIMKLTDGLFHTVFDEIAAEYPEIENESYIVDIGAARLADTPERFDVVLLPNLYGDILSDIAAQITGSVGLGGSSNIGDNFAMFEAIHGSAPDIAGQGIANPSGLILGAIQMLVYIGQPEVAEKIHNAWFKTLEDGIHTGDLYKDGLTKEKVGTQGFADAVIERLGQEPTQLPAVDYNKDSTKKISISIEPTKQMKKELVGVDVFLQWQDDNKNAKTLGDKLSQHTEGDLELIVMTNRGVKVWPKGNPETFCTDHWRCRFTSPKMDKEVSYQDVINLSQKLNDAGFDIIKTENLCKFDGKVSFSLAQGQ
jgi:isocitrate dehydrogenase